MQNYEIRKYLVLENKQAKKKNNNNNQRNEHRLIKYLQVIEF